MAKSEYPTVIPKTYEELERLFGGYIFKLLLRHNKVESNHEELCQDVWERLLKARFLERYWEKVDGTLPSTMLRDDACLFLGVTHGQWRSAMSNYHYRKRGHWMPVPINEAEFLAQGKGRGLAAKNALFDMDDIHKLAAEYADENGHAAYMFPNRGAIEMPVNKVTPLHFRNYLSRSVVRHFANYCRTKARRHKERLGDTFKEFRNYGEDTTVSWDQNLQSAHTQPAIWSKQEREEYRAREKAGKPKRTYMAVRSTVAVSHECPEETLVTLKEVTQRLKTTLRTGLEAEAHRVKAEAEAIAAQRKEHYESVAEERVQRVAEEKARNAVESCKPVEFHEAEMFEGLMAGTPLERVVKKMDIPVKVKRAVLRSVERS